MERDSTRTFLGFETPFLLALARHLLAPEFRAGLGSIVVVLPGRRAARRLLEHLAVEAGSAFEPPRIVTEADLAQELSRRPLLLASPVAVEWAWTLALDAAAREDVEVFAPRHPADPDASRRIGLARHLASMDRERATLGPRTNSPVGARLRALERIAQGAAERLASVGLVDPARALDQVRTAAARRPGVQVVLAGIAEVTPALRELLADLVPRPRVFVHDAPECAEGFDAWGGLVPEYWEARGIPLEETQWAVADDSAHAVQQSLAWLSELPPGTTLDEVALGVLGAELIPSLERALRDQGLSLHVAAGERARDGAPWKALAAVRDFVARGDFASLATLLRHADVEAALLAKLPESAASRDLVAELDRCHAEHLPQALSEELAGASPLSASACATRDAARELCAAWLDPRARPLAEWIAPWRALSCAIHPWVPAGEDAASQRTRLSLTAFAELALELEELGAKGWDTPVTAVEALDLLLAWTADRRLQPLRQEPSLEALGWLELALEEAPHLLLIGFNDGWVPQNEPPSPLEGAGEHDSREGRRRTRLARDAHALSALLRSRSGPARAGSVRSIALRRDVQGDPLRPSRLLFHAPDAAAIARARTFFDSAAERPLLTAVATPAASADFTLPIPIVPKLASMSVSSFKAYIDSPYLYYLRYVLRLERVRDDAWELDPALYGELAHAVLRDWGRSDARHSTDERTIAAFVEARLDEMARQRFGARPLPAVRLQLQQMQRRLREFARAQAAEAVAGWRVEEVEFSLEGAQITVEGESTRITGKVDRLDRRPATGEWRVLDYKTGESAHDPRKAHLGKEHFKDLQLLLYQHFLRERFAGAPSDAGYFALPKALEKTGVNLAGFTDDELQRAVRTAEFLIGRIRAGEFHDLGRARATDRVEKALCGISLLVPDEGASQVDTGGDEGEGEEEAGS